MLDTPIGFVERLVEGRIVGWGIEHQAGGAPSTIHLVVDGQAVDQLMPSIDRPDVSSLGLPGMAAGFEIKVPERFRDGRPHDLCLRFASGTFLNFIRDDGTFSQRITVTMAPDPVVEGHADGLVGSMLSGWVLHRDPLTGSRHSRIPVLIRIDAQDICSVVADLHRPDVVATLGTDGHCGFEVRPPVRFRDGQPHQVEVLANGVTHLVGSPFTYQAEAGMQESRYVSVDSISLLRRGRVGEDEAVKQGIVHRSRPATFMTTVGEFIPPYSYHRPAPHIIAGGSQSTHGDLSSYFDTINLTASTGIASRIVRLDHVYVHNNVIHWIDDGDVFTLYETARANDRPYTEQPEWDANSLQSAALRVTLGKPGLYVGSTGYINYGHWLIDDLPRINALGKIAKHAGIDEPRIIVPGATHVLNAVKEQSIRFMRPQTEAEDIIYIPPDKPVYFDVLYYVSPVSDHPVLKSPQACEMLRVRALKDAVSQAPGRTPSHIFVLRRSEHGRKLLNSKRVAAVFAKRGFEIVDAETMDFADQVRLFRDASFVAGCMGAAMTNTVFCGRGTDLLYLVPDGWMEPFYWDLAAACGHRYSTLFGPSTDRVGIPHKADFKIDLATLGTTLDRLLETPPAKG